jgi:hypothetical protein
VITCEQCAYWEPPQAEEKLGECRRNPPMHEFWPVTLGTDWCGQAMPRECGSTQPVHEAAQELLFVWDAHESVWLDGAKSETWRHVVEQLREALRRMKP